MEKESGSWEPIGDYGTNTTHVFKGTFEGNNHSILNIYINKNANYQGFFGYIENAVIKDLNIEGKVVNSNTYTGAIVGMANNSTIENCSNYADMTATYIERLNMGGIVGKANGSIIRKCSNYGDIIISKSYIGGITGVIVNTTIEQSINYGIIKSTGSTSIAIGGIVACANNSTIKTSVNNGEVYSAGHEAGGILGAQWANTTNYIYNSYNTKNVYGKERSGGICGHSSSNIHITNCYNIGKITGGTRGAMVSRESGTVYSTNCYYLNTCNASGYGTSKTDKELKELVNDNSLGEEFIADVLKDESESEYKYNNGYPILKWQLEEINKNN